MNRGNRKDRWAWTALHREVSRILWEKWDPIGVNRFPEARDEYDSYVPGLMELLESGCGASEIADYLWFIQTVRISIRKPGREHTDEIALFCVEARDTTP